MTLNIPALLTHIRMKADHPDLYVRAALTGLAIRIERGDFDHETPENRGGITVMGLHSEIEETGPGSAGNAQPGPSDKHTPLTRKEVLS